MPGLAFFCFFHEIFLDGFLERGISGSRFY